MGRNTPILQEIISVLDAELDDPAYALDLLESRFQTRLLLDVGNINTVGNYAEQLRLRITEDECSTVLDYIAEKQMVLVTIDVVENAINERLGWDRFIDP